MMISNHYRLSTVHPSKRVYRNTTASLHRAQSGVTPELMTALGFIDEQEREQIYRAKSAAMQVRRTANRRLQKRYQPHFQTILFPIGLCVAAAASLLFAAPHVHASEGMLPQRSMPFSVDARPLDATVARLGSQPVGLASRTAAERPLRRAIDVTESATALQESPRARSRAAIPSLDPTDGGEITSTFGYRTYPAPEFHRGIDLAAPTGHPVAVAADGIVTFAGWAGGFGNKIEIDHGNGYATWYGHLSRINVSDGQRVKRGSVIGEVGETGYATGPHLHYQIMLNGIAVDPLPYLRGYPARCWLRRRRGKRARSSKDDIVICTLSFILQKLVDIYILMMLAYALASWLPSLRGPWLDYVSRAVEPVLVPVRKVIPPIGGLDLSFLVVLLALRWLAVAIVPSSCAIYNAYF